MIGKKALANYNNHLRNKTGKHQNGKESLKRKEEKNANVIQQKG